MHSDTIKLWLIQGAVIACAGFFSAQPSQAQRDTSAFTFCHEKSGKCQTDRSAYWVNQTTRLDYERREAITEDLDGIVIVSEALKDNIAIYVIGYDGAGRYELNGSEDGILISDTNATYSDDVARWGHWIDPENTGGSYVEISESNDGVISGKFEIHVYYEGNKFSDVDGERTEIVFSGEFSGLERKPM